MENTQMSTKVSKSKVQDMALELMEKDFEVRGRVFNMNELGWRFSFSTHKSRFGQCSFRRVGFGDNRSITNKRLYLSQWLIQNSSKTFAEWKNTMLHEIAHAIDGEIRYTTNHDYRWKSIALAIGCDGKRCSSAEIDARASKYTLVCPNCGKETASHKKKRRLSACGQCCRDYNNGKFSMEFKLIQEQNY